MVADHSSDVLGVGEIEGSVDFVEDVPGRVWERSRAASTSSRMYLGGGLRGVTVV